MGWSLRELAERVSPAEFREWQAYERVEPFGERRQDLRHARLIASMANIHTKPPPGRRAWVVGDFYPEFKEVPKAVALMKGRPQNRTPLGNPKMTPKHMDSVLGLFMAANNAKYGGGGAAA